MHITTTNKTIYVGDSKYLRALSKNNLTIERLNERLLNGWTVEEDGSLLSPAIEEVSNPESKEGVLTAATKPELESEPVPEAELEHSQDRDTESEAEPVWGKETESGENVIESIIESENEIIHVDSGTASAESYIISEASGVEAKEDTFSNNEIADEEVKTEKKHESIGLVFVIGGILGAAAVYIGISVVKKRSTSDKRRSK